MKRKKQGVYVIQFDNGIKIGVTKGLRDHSRTSYLLL